MSRLPILSGDPVYAVVLRRRPCGPRGGDGGAGSSYPWDLWMPVGMPIPGSYNGIGTAHPNDPDDPGSTIARCTLQTILPTYEPNVVDALDTWCRAQQRTDDLPVVWGLCLLHQGVVDRLLVTERIESDMPPPATDDFQHWLMRMAEWNAGISAIAAQAHWGYPPFVADTAGAAYTALALMDCINQAMEALRVYWMPQCGQGSTACDWDACTTLAAIVAEHIDAGRARMSQRDDDDDEERG